MHCFQNTDMDSAVMHSPAKFESHLQDCQAEASSHVVSR